MNSFPSLARQAACRATRRTTRRVVGLAASATLLVGMAACTPPSGLPQNAPAGSTALASPLESPLANAGASNPVVTALPGIDQALADAPKDAPKPDAGKASISGLVYSPRMQIGVIKTGFYLTKGIGVNDRQISPILIGPDETKGDIRGYTDEKGVFRVNNLEPGNYYIILAAPNDWVPFERDATSAVPRLIELKANEQLALGVLYVPWP